MNASDIPRSGEIWIAYVYYEDNPNVFKRRPVLVLGEGFFMVEAMKITSKEPRVDDPLDYALVSWRESGLLFPSTVRRSKIVDLTYDQCIKKIGEIQSPDREFLETYFH